MSSGRSDHPSATYRVQLHGAFDFEAAAAIAGYLRDLGVTHLYSSPCFQATPGSTHGYDVVDPGRVSEELGGAQGHQRLVAALREAGLGLVVDIVPNHMAVGSGDNRWWWDVLENGPSSTFAHYFDVDWSPSQESPANQVLLPVLGDHYGRVLEAGELSVVRDGARFEIRYFEHRFPCASRSLDHVLGPAATRLPRSVGDELGFLADAFGALPAPTPSDLGASRRRHRDKEVLHRLLGNLFERHPKAASAVDDALGAINADPDALDALLRSQNFRLAHWRTAGQALDYRRFFDIHSLVALRVEDPEVFEDSQRLVLEWIRDDAVQGLRVDHIDGLRDPDEYLRRLRAAGPQLWIVVEKILEREEQLPAGWPVQGSTGYDFLNLATGLFVDPIGEAELTRFYDELAGEPVRYPELVVAAKAEVLRDALGSEVNRLGELAARACAQHRRHRDHTRHELREALVELIARFPVYRTYAREQDDELRDVDRRRLEGALEAVQSDRSDIDPELLEFLGNLLSLRWRGAIEVELAMRFQQVTGPAMAKGVEDTAFYRYARFVALNEVGGDPSRFGVTPGVFHDAMERAAASHPRGMNATSTHDTKRSEDVRARLVLLSEIPERWARCVRDWSEANRKHAPAGVPDAVTQYFYYQNLVGAWPIDADRMTAYMVKAAREAKLHTSWTHIDEAFEERLVGFVRATLADEAFTASVQRLVGDLVAPGRCNALAQKLLALTAPGVGDLYQGTELWDLSLVDPDNRRPVDFALRRRLLDELDGLTPEEILARMDEGLPKLWLVRQALRLRRRAPAAFEGYAPLATAGARADRVVAYERGGGEVAVAVPRLVLGAGDWGDTSVALPPGSYRNELTGEGVDGGAQPVASLFARFPVALLSRRAPQAK